MRMNTFDCVQYQQTNLVPATYEMDDYQVRTPTDVIGQHIHLPKWDLTAADGSANGWNYEDGVLSPGAVQERMHAIRTFNQCTGADVRDGTPACPKAKNHPYFGQFGRADWVGARTAMQRWFIDPVVNTKGIDRGLGTIFTHDHLGPSTYQQIGLYATVLTWFHAETGEPLYSGARQDGGPTSWQAVVYNDVESMSLPEVERDMVRKMLDKTDWNVTKSARLLGLSRDMLRYRIEKLGLERPDKRQW